jgi:hypothetical protein
MEKRNRFRIYLSTMNNYFSLVMLRWTNIWMYIGDSKR